MWVIILLALRCLPLILNQTLSEQHVVKILPLVVIILRAFSSRRFRGGRTTTGIPVAATNAFLDNVRKNTGDPIKDAWDVQHWNAPDFRTDPVGFWTSKETVNYIDHLTRLDKILETGRLP